MTTELEDYNKWLQQIRRYKGAIKDVENLKKQLEASIKSPEAREDTGTQAVGRR